MILDYGRSVHVCSQKEKFRYVVEKEEGIIKDVDDTSCKVVYCNSKVIYALFCFLCACTAVQ